MSTEQPTPPPQRKNTWLDRQPFTVTQEQFDTFKRLKKGFHCQLCGHVFAVGDKARWIYCNSTPGQQTGNFFVCGNCDGEDAVIMQKAKEELTLAVTLAKKWDIYESGWHRY